ncbi:unnamed protein product [Fraxinus pennsylvanica]|uniref:Replication factor-A protein 1 N-terminal domain-containing protein n=1 Tax=Fraxinus pennsylvanica TaxID=56036 RepID=A0AAD2AK57_9LAMI|nr:unnamed protein product [Fraxinus pennsylvanica]
MSVVRFPPRTQPATLNKAQHSNNLTKASARPPHEEDPDLRVRRLPPDASSALLDLVIGNKDSLGSMSLIKENDEKLRIKKKIEDRSREIMSLDVEIEISVIWCKVKASASGGSSLRTQRLCLRQPCEIQLCKVPPLPNAKLPVAASPSSDTSHARFIANDGKMKVKAMFQSTLSSLITSGSVQNLGLIRILDYTLNDIPTKNEK